MYEEEDVFKQFYKMIYHYKVPSQEIFCYREYTVNRIL